MKFHLLSDENKHMLALRTEVIASPSTRSLDLPKNNVTLAKIVVQSAIKIGGLGPVQVRLPF